MPAAHGKRAGGSDERRRFGLCACFSPERPHSPWRGAASCRLPHALALLSMADCRRVLRCRGHGPDRREHCPARLADFGAGIRLHSGKRKLGRARLSLGCRGIHADLRPALPDLWQKAVLHRRLRRVHVGQRSLRLRAGSPHPCRASVPARGGRSDDWRQQHGACRRGDGQEPARARAWAVCRRPSGRDQRRPCRRRPVDRDFGLALGVLGQRSCRADLDRRRLAHPSGHAAAEPHANVRLAWRSPARAGFDARGVCAEPSLRARAGIPRAPGFCRRRDRAFLPVRQAGKQERSRRWSILRCSKVLRFWPARWRARSPTPCFTACSSSLRSPSCAVTRTVLSLRGSSLRSFRVSIGIVAPIAGGLADRIGARLLSVAGNGRVLCRAHRAHGGRDGAHPQSLGRLPRSRCFRNWPRRVHCAKQPRDDQRGSGQSCGRRRRDAQSDAHSRHGRRRRQRVRRAVLADPGRAGIDRAQACRLLAPSFRRGRRRQASSCLRSSRRSPEPFR